MPKSETVPSTSSRFSEISLARTPTPAPMASSRAREKPFQIGGQDEQHGIREQFAQRSTRHPIQNSDLIALVPAQPLAVRLSMTGPAGQHQFYRCIHLLIGLGDRTIRFTQDDGSSPRLRHLLTNDDGVPGFGIDPGSDRLTAARYGVCVFLLGDYAVLDDLRARWRHLAANRGRRSSRRRRRSRSNRLLLGRAAYKAEKQNEPQVSH